MGFGAGVKGIASVMSATNNPTKTEPVQDASINTQQTAQVTGRSSTMLTGGQGLGGGLVGLMGSTSKKLLGN